MRALFFPFLFLSMPLTVSANEAFSHKLFHQVLEEFVGERGLVNYQALKDNPSNLKSYVALLGAHSPENAPEQFPSKAHQLAYWLNAYNALAMLNVVENYPVDSVKDIKWFSGFFNRTKHRVGGQSYTLNHIEHKIIRKSFDDPRIHAGLNCASMGCPQLPQQAYEAESLDENLEEDMRQFLREERNVRIDREKNKIYLSEILKNFESDFTTWYKKKHEVKSASILDYVKLFVEKPIVQYLDAHPRVKIEYLNYDWRLNDQKLER